MKFIASTKNIKQEKINITNQFFSFPNSPFTFYYVAQKENGTNGFVIDGKRLCFKYAHENIWEDIDQFTLESGWIDKLRELSNPTYKTEEKPQDKAWHIGKLKRWEMQPLSDDVLKRYSGLDEHDEFDHWIEKEHERLLCQEQDENWKNREKDQY
jgi:hypothetical protein